MSQVKPLVHDLNNKLQVIMGATELGSLETALLACDMAQNILAVLHDELKNAIAAKIKKEMHSALPRLRKRA